MTTDDSARAQAFGAVAAAYDAGRPTFPADALTWVLGPGRLQVLDLGAGTGKLTEVAAGLGHDVIAVDPSEEMLALCGRVRGVETLLGTAEAIPLAHGSVDAVLVGQAFHWFDHARALPEIARVLRPNGALGLLWNHFDTVVPWVRRLHRAIMGEDFLAGSDHFDRCRRCCSRTCSPRWRRRGSDTGTTSTARAFGSSPCRTPGSPY
jgi:SAM-dependent methyltransferase